MKIEVLHGRWAYEDEVYEGGEQMIAKPSKALLEGIAAAAACPDPPVRVVSASKDEKAVLGAAVQSQKDGEKALAEAMESGEWHVGNAQAMLDRIDATLELHDHSLKDGSLDGRLTDEELGYALFARDQTVDILDRIEDGASYEDAAAAWHSERKAADVRAAEEG